MTGKPIGRHQQHHNEAEAHGAALQAILDGHYDHVDELLQPFTPAHLRRLSQAAADLATMARVAALRPYLHLDEIAQLPALGDSLGGREG